MWSHPFPQVCDVSASQDRYCWFKISKGLLVSTVDLFARSWPLIVKMGQSNDHCDFTHMLIKGNTLGSFSSSLRILAVSETKKSHLSLSKFLFFLYIPIFRLSPLPILWDFRFSFEYSGITLGAFLAFGGCAEAFFKHWGSNLCHFLLQFLVFGTFSAKKVGFPARSFRFWSLFILACPCFVFDWGCYFLLDMIVVSVVIGHWT